MTTILQTALDLTEGKRALQIAEEAVKGGTDWIEAGTPLVKSEGMNIIRSLKKAFPDKRIVADLKTSDTGGLGVEMAAKAGADIVCILASADDAVIRDALRGAALYGVELMADMMNVKDPAARAKELAEMGVQIINAHVGIDQQMGGGKSPGPPRGDWKTWRKSSCCRRSYERDRSRSSRSRSRYRNRRGIDYQIR